jgi:hypothetical protein
MPTTLSHHRVAPRSASMTATSNSPRRTRPWPGAPWPCDMFPHGHTSSLHQTSMSADMACTIPTLPVPRHAATSPCMPCSRAGRL